MQPDPLADVVSRQYERWVYPEPITDLPGWLEHNWQWFDPSHAQRLLWPDRPTRGELDILIAGCGANQAAVFAFTNPASRVVGIDVSGSSLDHHRFLKDTYHLENLELHQLPVEDVGILERDFDLIVSTGVLHHLHDPAVGLAALGRCLRSDGVAGIMLYARFGRIGVEMLQEVFRGLGLDQDEASVELVKEALAILPPEHPLQAYLAMAPDLQFDAGLVDTFLHGRDRSSTTADCIDLVSGAGLVFDDWFLKAPYAPPVDSDNAFYAAVADLPRERQWSVMERINPRNGCHFFTARRPECPPSTYRIDFASEAFLNFVPSLRYRCVLTSERVGRADWTTPIDATQYALLRLMDDRRTIGAILDTATGGTDLERMSNTERLEYARALFRSLWQLDVAAMGLRPG